MRDDALLTAALAPVHSALQIGMYQVIYLNRSAEEAFKPLAAFKPYVPFRDASCGVSTFHLTVFDVIKAGERSMLACSAAGRPGAGRGEMGTPGAAVYRAHIAGLAGASLMERGASGCGRQGAGVLQRSHSAPTPVQPQECHRPPAPAAPTLSLILYECSRVQLPMHGKRYHLKQAVRSAGAGCSDVRASTDACAVARGRGWGGGSTGAGSGASNL